MSISDDLTTKFLARTAFRPAGEAALQAESLAGHEGANADEQAACIVVYRPLTKYVWETKVS